MSALFKSIHASCPHSDINASRVALLTVQMLAQMCSTLSKSIFAMPGNYVLFFGTVLRKDSLNKRDRNDMQ